MLLTPVAFLALAQSSANAPALVPGMKAPALTVGGWLKQDAPKAQKGHLRVVEFWAIWCEPCKAAMPHLSELAHRYEDRLDVVGVDVMEPAAVTPAHLKRFVASMGDKMDYRVAYDTPKGTMKSTWLMAAGLNSIPSTFLLDDAGTILWIGHPNGLEAQLKVAFAGKPDVAANRAAFLTASNWFEGSKAAIKEAGEAYRAGRKDEAEKIWNEIQSTWPRAEFMVRKARLDTYPPGSAESKGVVDQMLAGNVVARETAIDFAMKLPDGERSEAEAIVDRAVAGKPDDSLSYATAVAYNRLGAYPKAVQTADTALAQIDGRLADPKYAPLRPLIEAWHAKFKKVHDEAALKSLPKFQ